MSNPSVKHLPYGATAITDQLFIAPIPRTQHIEDIRTLRVDLVISMLFRAPPPELAKPPFKLIRLPSIDFPGFPIPMFWLRKGAAAASLVIDAGGRVLVYCRAGRHRSVAMASCILIAQGMTADEAMDTITAKREVADPHAFHIESRIRAFERDWTRRKRPATG
jgi:hypothetical protein